MGIIPDDPFCLNLDFLLECGLPYEGVQEVCLLHDVLEDTEVTLAEIEEYYAEFGLREHFNNYIKAPLLLVTHDKSEGYDPYIARLLDNPVSSIVKLCDLADNMNPLGLDLLGEKELDRMRRYAGYAKTINDRWQFLEKALYYAAYKNER